MTTRKAARRISSKDLSDGYDDCYSYGYDCDDFEDEDYDVDGEESSQNEDQLPPSSTRICSNNFHTLDEGNSLINWLDVSRSVSKPKTKHEVMLGSRSDKQGSHAGHSTRSTTACGDLLDVTKTHPRQIEPLSQPIITVKEPLLGAGRRRAAVLIGAGGITVHSCDPRSPLDLLPAELWLSVLLMLDVGTILRTSRTCNFFRSLVFFGPPAEGETSLHDLIISSPFATKLAISSSDAIIPSSTLQLLSRSMDASQLVEEVIAYYVEKSKTKPSGRHVYNICLLPERGRVRSMMVAKEGRCLILCGDCLTIYDTGDLRRPLENIGGDPPDYRFWQQSHMTVIDNQSPIIFVARSGSNTLDRYSVLPQSEQLQRRRRAVRSITDAIDLGKIVHALHSFYSAPNKIFAQLSDQTIACVDAVQCRVVYELNAGCGPIETMQVTTKKLAIGYPKQIYVWDIRHAPPTQIGRLRKKAKGLALAMVPSTGIFTATQTGVYRWSQHGSPAEIVFQVQSDDRCAITHATVSDTVMVLSVTLSSIHAMEQRAVFVLDLSLFPVDHESSLLPLWSPQGQPVVFASCSSDTTGFKWCREVPHPIANTPFSDIMVCSRVITGQSEVNKSFIGISRYALKAPSHNHVLFNIKQKNLEWAVYDEGARRVYGIVVSQFSKDGYYAARSTLCRHLVVWTLLESPTQMAAVGLTPNGNKFYSSASFECRGSGYDGHPIISKARPGRAPCCAPSETPEIAALEASNERHGFDRIRMLANSLPRGNRSKVLKSMDKKTQKQIRARLSARASGGHR